MDKRERILELVREGVLSVDEGLDLLDSIAKEESKRTEETEFTSDQADETVEETVEPETEKETPNFEQDTTDAADAIDDAEEQTKEDMKKHEEELEQLATEINRFSAEVDGINEELTEAKRNLAEVEEELQDRRNNLNEDYYEEKKELENEIINLQKQIELISMIEEVDNHEELASLNKDLTRAMERLRGLENLSASDEKSKELQVKAEALREDVDRLTQVKNERLKELHSLKMKQWSTKAKQMSETIEIPNEWREGANKTIDKAGDIFEETSRTVGDIFRQTVATTKDALENVNWKDIEINLGGAKDPTEVFEHEWLFENTRATILDFKNANGDIQVKPSLNDNIKINANIRLYGTIDEADPIEAFEARSQISIDDDKFIFHVPNKNVAVDMIIYLPAREYDYIRLNSLNGDVTFNELNTRDIYVKATNGDIIFNDLTATMLEVKGTNGNITLKDIKLRDLLVGTVNGDVRVVGAVQSSDVKTTNGDIRITLHDDDLIRVAGGSVNGDVKISFPEQVGLEIEAKSTFGKVKSRLSDTQSTLSKEGRGKTHYFTRIGSGSICRVTAETTTGNVLFKDVDTF
jgi:DUF4097 and DUF4098 domain-containing protein YvlB